MRIEIIPFLSCYQRGERMSIDMLPSIISLILCAFVAQFATTKRAKFSPNYWMVFFALVLSSFATKTILVSIAIGIGWLGGSGITQAKSGYFPVILPLIAGILSFLILTVVYWWLIKSPEKQKMSFQNACVICLITASTAFAIKSIGSLLLSHA